MKRFQNFQRSRRGGENKKKKRTAKVKSTNLKCYALSLYDKKEQREK